MTVQMQPVRQVVSPNFSARAGSIRLIVVHDTEGSYAGAVAWFAETRAQVSAHLVMNEDGSEVTQMVPLGAKAWHACAFNSASIGIEGAGVEAKGFSDAWWRGMAKIVAWLLVAYDLPCRWAQGGEGAGYCSHHDLGAAGGGHGDPVAVGAPQWAAFESYVQGAYDALRAGPLPAFALHGAPAPHEIAPAPAVPPEPSHGGAPRYDPVGPIPASDGALPEWIQAFLIAHGARLDEDGLLGPASQRAIADFLAGHAA
jgi:hypothetical protein